MCGLVFQLRPNGVPRSSPTKIGKHGHLTYGASSANPATLVADVTTKANPPRGGGAKPMGLSKSAGSRVAERRLGRARGPKHSVPPRRRKERYRRVQERGKQGDVGGQDRLHGVRAGAGYGFGLGVAATAWSATGGNFILGKGNVATAITRLAGAEGVDGPMLRIRNNNADPNDTALGLRVQTGEAPMRVNSDTKVANLNADMVDGTDASQLATNTSEGWHEIGAPGEPTFGDGWSNGTPTYICSGQSAGCVEYNTAGFYKDSLGVVHLKGSIKLDITAATAVLASHSDCQKDIGLPGLRYSIQPQIEAATTSSCFTTATSR